MADLNEVSSFISGLIFDCLPKINALIAFASSFAAGCAELKFEIRVSISRLIIFFNFWKSTFWVSLI